MFQRKLIFPILALMMVQTSLASERNDSIPAASLKGSKAYYATRTGFFNHMDLGITAGATGLGLDIAMPVSRWARVRAGYTYMPRFKITSKFGVEFDQSRNIVDSPADYADKIRRMKELMGTMSGYQIEDNVDMEMEPTFGNFKFLVDFLPFNNKHWHFTAGIYVGKPRIGKACNAAYDAPTLLAVGMYNSFYKKAYTGDPMISYEDYNGVLHDVDLPPSFSEKFASMGMMGMPLGHFKDGDQAMMVPDANGVARAEMVVKKVRPYVGLGFDTSLSPDGKLRLALDAGVLLWGGAPRVYVDNVYSVSAEKENTMLGDWVQDENGEWVCEERPTYRIDLVRDVDGIPGKTGRWVDICKKMRCMPTFSLTVSYSLF